jgi:hypothetical protein
MKSNAVIDVQNNYAPGFDLVRLSKSKQAVDLAPNTIRAFVKQGLRLFKQGKMVWFSRSELAEIIKRQNAS